jgi:membrane-associated phospholipid phosphatase
MFTKTITAQYIKELIFFAFIPAFFIESLRSCAWSIINALNIVQVKYMHWWQIIPDIPADHAIVQTDVLNFIYMTETIVVLFFPTIMYIVFGKKLFFFYLFNVVWIYIFVYTFYIFFPCFDYLKVHNWDGKANNDALKYGNFCAFPSSHCLIAYAIALPTFLSFLIEKQKNNKLSISVCLIAIIWAILIQISTILNRQHYILDGIASLLIVITFTCVSFIIYKKRYIKNNKVLWTQTSCERFYKFATANKKREIKTFVIFAILFVILNVLVTAGFLSLFV